MQVCPGSAKVRLNTAILRRRRGDWGGALEHLDAAQAIDPTYCEADFWRGLTLLQSSRCRGLLPPTGWLSERVPPDSDSCAS